MTEPSQLAENTIALCKEAVEANQTTLGRRGAIVELTAEEGDEILVSADLHGQRLNFERLCDLADLAAHSRRHLLMQEVCHGGPFYPECSGCMSHLLLEDIVQLKTEFPDQFHFILSNHELAEMMDFPIAKGNRMLNLQFRTGIEQLYGDYGEEVRHYYNEFLITCPLAVRLDSGVLISHSAPEGVDLHGFDVTIFDREKLTAADMKPDGGAFHLVWGRDFRPANARAFAELMKVNVLVHGHEPCKNGYQVPNDTQVIIDCCGENAVYMNLPIHGEISHAEVVESIRPLSW